MLYEQDNTKNQYSGYIICIFASIEYDGLSVANMQQRYGKIKRGLQKDTQN